MRNRGLTVALAMVFLSCGFFFGPASRAGSLVGPDWATKWVIYNASNADVTCMVQVQAIAGNTNIQDGCAIGSVSPLRIIDLTGNEPPKALIPFETPLQGWFKLKRGQKVQIVNLAISPATKQPNYCLTGTTVGFGQFPAACPDSINPSGHTAFPNTSPGSNFNQEIFPPLPNGSNGAEATINLPGTKNGQIITGLTTNESVDLTCLSGANATIVGQLIPPPAGPYWAANLGPAGGGNRNFKTPVSFQNSWVNIAGHCDDNCVDPKTGLARPGVFPYGCSQCNQQHDPGPACGAGAQFCAAKNGLPANNGCNFTRAPQVSGVQKFGGTFLVTYMGPLSPPKNSCK